MTLDEAGQAYQHGELSIEQVASELCVSVMDAVALLEGAGFVRPVACLCLNDAERRRRLELIRADRIARGGAPQLDETLIVREVVASQRLEGIDARPARPSRAPVPKTGTSR